MSEADIIQAINSQGDRLVSVVEQQSTLIREATAAMLRAAEAMERTAERIESQTAANAERLTAIEIRLERLTEATEQNAATAQIQAQNVQDLIATVNSLLARN